MFEHTPSHTDCQICTDLAESEECLEIPAGNRGKGLEQLGRMTCMHVRGAGNRLIASGAPASPWPNASGAANTTGMVC